jgi:hypothetical protein
MCLLGPFLGRFECDGLVRRDCKQGDSSSCRMQQMRTSGINFAPFSMLNAQRSTGLENPHFLVQFLPCLHGNRAIARSARIPDVPPWNCSPDCLAFGRGVPLCIDAGRYSASVPYHPGGKYLFSLDQKGKKKQIVTAGSGWTRVPIQMRS